MNAQRWFASPLAGTAAVLAALGLLAIPLHHITSRAAEPASPPPMVRMATDEVAAVLRLHLLAPASHVRIIAEDGKVLLDASDLDAGESEHDAMLRLSANKTDLTLLVEMADTDSETAVFLTVMPDGREDQTRHIIGSDTLVETLHYAWPQPQ